MDGSTLATILLIGVFIGIHFLMHRGHAGGHGGRGGHGGGCGMHGGRHGQHEQREQHAEADHPADGGSRGKAP